VRTSGFLLAAGAAIVVGAAAFGPPAMRLLFGADFSGSRAQLSMLGAGVAFYLGAATISQALLAADRGARAAIGWAAAAAVFVCLYALVPGAQLTRVGAALAVATATDLVLLALLAARTRST
jgi:O-antigen/teichoic acid export membrane protein